MTMISTQMAPDIMNWAFQIEFCMFKVNKSEFNVMVAITSHPVEAFKKLPKHTQKQKQDGSIGAYFCLIAQNSPQTLKSPNFGFSLRRSSSYGRSPQKASKLV